MCAQVRNLSLQIVDEAMNGGEYDMSMVAGEFVEIYSKQENKWDCVVTCFFLDTAHNIIECIECI